jgi:hypothetical protein
VPVAKMIEIGAGIPGIMAFAILLILNWQSLLGEPSTRAAQNN